MSLRFCPGAFAVAEGGVWVGDSALPALVRIDPQSNRVVAMVSVASDDSEHPVLDLAAGCGGIWSGDAGGRILRRDTATAEVRATIPLEQELDPWTWAGCSVAVGAGAVWVTRVFNGSVTRIDPVSNTVARTIPVGRSLDCVAVAYGSVWVLDTAQEALARIDPATGRVAARLSLGVRPEQVGVGEGAVWISVDGGWHGPRILRVDPATIRPVSALRLGEMPESFDVGEGALWEVTTTSAKSEVPETVHSTIRKIDPTTYATLATVPVEGLVIRLRHGGGALWAATWRSAEQAGRVIRIDPVEARVAAVIELPDLTVVPVQAETYPVAAEAGPTAEDGSMERTGRREQHRTSGRVVHPLRRGSSPADQGGEPTLEPDMSVEIHRGSAEFYDTSTACFWHYRSLAVERLRLHPGEVVVDVGCGTGLCFPMIEQRIGRQGRLIGIEPCPQMMSRAARRVDAHRWSNVTLVREPAEKATLPVACDAALFCATHDILRSSIALKNVLGQLRYGGRAVAIGGKWAPAWMPALNFAVFAHHWPWARTFEGFERPWSQMEQLVGDLQVETLAFGGGFVAWGIVRP